MGIFNFFTNMAKKDYTLEAKELPLSDRIWGFIEKNQDSDSCAADMEFTFKIPYAICKTLILKWACSCRDDFDNILSKFKS